MATPVDVAATAVLMPRAATSAGSHQNAGPNSVSGMLSTLIPGLLVAVLLVGLFLVLRTKVQRIYLPRTYLGVLSAHQKSPKASQTVFGWVPEFLRIDNDFVLNHHSLDAYFFLRFWKRVVLICAVPWPLTWIVLMPIYGTSHGGEQQFDKISFSNIDASQDGYRLFGVAFIACIVFGLIMCIIARESLFAVRVQQAYLRLSGIATRISARTVLFTGVPSSHLPSENSIRTVFPAVRTIYFVPQTKELDDLVKDRTKCVQKLEGALVKRSKQGNDQSRKSERNNDEEAQKDLLNWLDKQKRPTHRLRPLIGKKVDTIDYCQQHISELNTQVAKQQQSFRQHEGDLASAVFIEFDTVEAAEAAFHRTTIGNVREYSARAVGLRPDTVIWDNLSMGTAQRKIRNAVVIAVICVMIIFWGPITAFIGALSNINSLTNRVAFLSFINKIPGVILGVVTGLLPTILLAVLMILVPIIMRLLFKFAGAATVAEVELKTQTWYFVFQFIQVFLITTLSSGAAATATTIVSQPAQATNLLAKNLPKASNFYINYFVLYGLAVAAQELFNIVAVLLYLVLGTVLDKTPRKMYNRYINITGLKWGSIYPKFVNLVVIAIAYSCIAPLILGFAAIGFVFLGLAYRYAVVYSVDTTQMNTRGDAYLKALQQLTTGVYLAELCLIGLMGINTGSSKRSIGPLVIMIVLLVVTIVFHILLSRAISSMRKDIADEFNPETLPEDTKEQTALPSDPKAHANAIGRTAHEAAEANASAFERMLHIPAMPTFAKYLETPMPAYTEEERQNAYMHPSVAQPEPLLWIVRDNVGVSARDKREVAKFVQITDEGAWWDEKGKLRTVWTDDRGEKGEDAVRQAPIWEENVHY